MAQESINLATGIGRLVRGSLTERQTTDYDGNPYEEGKGPFELGFAIRKDEASVGDLLAKIYNQAASGFATNPTIVQRIQSEWQSGFTIGAFRFKIRDGDKPNQKGVINQNTVGCWVFNLSSYIPFKVTYTDQYGLPRFKDATGREIAPRTEIDASLVNIGDFAHVGLGVKINDKTDHTAGVYLNVNGVMLAARGERITGGISLEDAFANVPVSALPPGASVTAMPGQQQAQALPMGNAAPAASALPANPGLGMPTTASPIANVQPHTAFVNGPGATVGMPAAGGLPLPGQ